MSTEKNSSIIIPKALVSSSNKESRDRPRIRIDPDGKVFSSTSYLFNYKFPFDTSYSDLTKIKNPHKIISRIRKTPEKVLAESKANKTQASNYYLYGASQDTAHCLFSTNMHNLTSYAIYRINDKVSPAFSITSLKRIMEFMGDSLMTSIRKEIKQALNLVLKSYPFKVIIADTIAVQHIIPKHWLNRCWIISPVYDLTSCEFIRNTKDFLDWSMVDKIVAAHGFIPLNSIPPNVLGHIRPNATTVEDCVKEIGIAKKDPILILSLSHMGWSSYIHFILTKLKYHKNSFPLTLFHIL